MAAVIKCKMCGGNLTLIEGQSVAECEYCGSRQTVPLADDERKMSLFARANALRFACDFDKAAGIYETIAADFPEEAESYWGLCLCKYGIEYVDDPATDRKIPTCHRTLPRSILEDNDYRTAVSKADAVSRNVYNQEAEQIDGIQKKILAVVAQEEPYDVFICYKETDEDTQRRTDDSAEAQDLYTELTRAGYRVFFARHSLRAKAGSEYEPYIYAALTSAKVMLVIGTREEYFNAVWVKNEWSRFLDMMKTRPEKILIPCFRNMDAYDMPREFRNLQALDMGHMMFYDSLKTNLERAIPRKKAEAPATAVSGGSGNSVSLDVLIEKAYAHLQAKDWFQANSFADKTLDFKTDYADAYLIRLMSKLHITHKDDLTEVAADFRNDPNYLNYLKYATGHRGEEMTRYAQDAADRAVYQEALSLGDGNDEDKLARAVDLLSDIPHWADAEKQARRLNEKYKDLVYTRAQRLQSRDSLEDWTEAARLFASIHDWKDAEKQQKICEDKRNELIYQKAMTLKSRRLLEANEAFFNSARYRRDKMMPDDIKTREYDEAIGLLLGIPDYKDARAQITACEDGKKELVYRKAIEIKNRKQLEDSWKFRESERYKQEQLLPWQIKYREYDEAIGIFRSIAGYGDTLNQIYQCEELKKEVVYNEANALVAAGTSGEVAKAIELFQSLSGWRDADNRTVNSMTQLYNCYLKESKDKQKCISVINQNWIRILIVLGMALIGYFLSFHETKAYHLLPVLAENKVLTRSIGTLLMQMPLFMAMGEWDIIPGAPLMSIGKELESPLALRCSLIGGLIFAIPVYAVWWVLAFLNRGVLGLMPFLMKVLNIGCLLLAIFGIGGLLLEQSLEVSSIAKYKKEINGIYLKMEALNENRMDVLLMDEKEIGEYASLNDLLIGRKQ